MIYHTTTLQRQIRFNVDRLISQGKSTALGKNECGKKLLENFSLMNDVA